MIGAPVLVAGAGRSVWIDADGEIARLDNEQVRRRLRSAAPPLLVHARASARRLGATPFRARDLLELHAFVYPARPVVPTARGVLAAVGIDAPHDPEAQAPLLLEAARLLLGDLRRTSDRAAAGMLRALTAADWSWAAPVARALEGVAPESHGLAVWRTLPEISEHAPPPPPGNLPVEPADARRRLAELLGSAAEPRPTQSDYAAAVSAAFAPRGEAGAPETVLAEAGTGVGKTVGYLAPASLWAELNDGAVWVSTYTRNLQQQIDTELTRLYPDADLKRVRVVVRKGRENYLCLLNLDEATQGLGARPEDGVALTLMARWAAETRDGDLTGADFPGWLPELVGRGRTIGLADRRGECVYSACQHYSRCFVERSIRRARRARVVVANHALVMVQAAFAGDEDGLVPRRIVFDEGHHLFDAADSAFALDLSGIEGSELRRWLIGAETGSRSRARGLRRRVEELVVGSAEAERALLDTITAARVLPREGWQERLAEGRPDGVIEAFLETARQQVAARTATGGDGYGRETDLHPAIDGLVEAAEAAIDALTALHRPLAVLRARLVERLADEAEDLDTALRVRIESLARSIQRRALLPLAGWQAMLRAVGHPSPDEHVDWVAIDRADGRDADVALRRHWVDPTIPLAAVLAEPVHGLLVTSATLADTTGDAAHDWAIAEQRTGAAHLPKPAVRVAVSSPFDYGRATRVLVVNDVRKDDLGQVAGAYRALIRAAGGGTLGLFTAISRLREVHRRIAPTLEEMGLPLYAQHVDAMETGTLIDVFRAEVDASLLGTDAVRDGVDVPGRSLRLIVFDRVPWPRPDILHRARRTRFGGRDYDDRLARLRLKQAFGRLIRRADDRGVFVLLDPMMPSRLAGAFPAAAPFQRVGLTEATDLVRGFLTPG